MPIHFPHHEHHRQGFSRTLRVPNDAAPLAGILALKQTLHCQLHRAELLVAGHHLDHLALGVGAEDRERADEIQKVVPIQHPGHEALLVIRTAISMVQIVQRARIRIRPPVEMFFVVRGERAELRLLAAGGDHELIVEKQRRTAFALGSTLLTVAQQLVDGFGNGFLHLRRLRFDHHHGQPVEEKHDVRDDVALATEDADLELADGDKAVVVPVLEINELHRRTFFTRLAVLADAGVFQQLVEHMPVVLQQVGAGEIGSELFHHLIHLILLQPRVDHLQLLPQHR